MKRNATRSPSTRCQQGMSLLEVLVALGILAFGLLSLAAMQIEALGQGSKGRHTTDASAIGRSYLEQVMRLPWTELDVAQAIGTFTPPSWTGAPATFDVTVDAPGGISNVTEQSYTVDWRVANVGADSCLRDIELRVSWAEDDFAAGRSMLLATRRFNTGDPSC